jgi:Holliday junction resolvasome RuvABC DNA-binding subunit
MNKEISNMTLKELREEIQKGNSDLLWDAIYYIAGKQANKIIPHLKRFLNLIGVQLPKPKKEDKYGF